MEMDDVAKLLKKLEGQMSGDMSDASTAIKEAKYVADKAIDIAQRSMDQVEKFSDNWKLYKEHGQTKEDVILFTARKVDEMVNHDIDLMAYGKAFETALSTLERNLGEKLDYRRPIKGKFISEHDKELQKMKYQGIKSAVAFVVMYNIMEDLKDKYELTTLTKKEEK